MNMPTRRQAGHRCSFDLEDQIRLLCAEAPVLFVALRTAQSLGLAELGLPEFGDDGIGPLGSILGRVGSS